ncbi:PsiF family protein [Sapientia aquatica]|uniref:Phosphate starvation-inducible protein PsiF n=1 Tax=Sapientia aquatica TaxID=1549640 RepID=A0A4V3AV08_9BURK|nr:PsiF family protein [Sapientia aquatica]TDK67538.1 phosphate starvation-inducible protein PsiF [Sapientia aquatica]
MKKLLLVVALCLPFFAVHAENAQQSKMATCNKDATGKKGDERKAFMKDCLSAKPVVEEKKLTPQQEKMKSCNADAKGMKGDERKTFMSNCLKKS